MHNAKHNADWGDIYQAKLTKAKDLTIFNEKRCIACIFTQQGGEGNSHPFSFILSMRRIGRSPRSQQNSKARHNHIRRTSSMMAQPHSQRTKNAKRMRSKQRRFGERYSTPRGTGTPKCPNPVPVPTCTAAPLVRRAVRMIHHIPSHREDDI